MLVFSVADVRRLVKERRILELDGYIPFTVDVHIINLWVSQWEITCLQSFAEIERDVIQLLDSLCDTHFDRFRTSGFLAAVRLTPSILLNYLTVAGRKSAHVLMMRLEM